MIQSETNIFIRDREHAGRLLGKKLNDYKDGDAVVVGIPYGGVCVAAALSDVLVRTVFRRRTTCIISYYHYEAQ